MGELRAHPNKPLRRSIARQYLSVACSFLLLPMLAVASPLSERNASSASTDLRFFEGDNNCHTRYNIQLNGQHIFQKPLDVATPKECCDECQQRDNCAGWIFHACCNRCSLFKSISSVERCRQGDCVAGITDDMYRHHEQNYLQGPRNNFEGYTKTCEQRHLQTQIGAVLMACGTLERDCASSDTKLRRQSTTLLGSPCQMQMGVNGNEFDYNDGFQEHTLTPEDCCRKCLRDRGCHAWVRTAAGNCWLKFDVPPPQKRTKIPGDVFGIRPSLNVSCGERAFGVVYNAGNPTEKNETSAEDADQCCERCVEHGSCLVWSFFNGICRRIFTVVGITIDRDSNATSAFMNAEPYDCSESNVEVVTPLEIARTYKADCASILLYGPSESRIRCQGIEDAEKIFDDALGRFQRILSQN